MPVVVVPVTAIVWAVLGGFLLFLALLGALAARTGGSPVMKSVFRVTFWGALAMAMTARVGVLFGARP
ncbi:MAG: VIT1/CCC1 transporter family protein [Verrucomicrobiota bacterium]